MSSLTAVMLLINSNGSVIHKMYISDVFPQNLNSFEFVKLQKPGGAHKSDIPGFYSDMAVVHSQIN